jgi:secreted PhoX family phosphatase
VTATIDNVVYTLPKFGRFPWENAVPRPSQGNEIVVMNMEDGPSTPDSQLYMYVGKKDRSRGADILNRNGLNNGRLYVFRSKDPSRNSEVTLQSGSVIGEWVEIQNAEMMTDAQLEAAADARNAFGFIRTEDGAWSKTSRKDYYFCTTGSSYSATTGGTPANKLGRLYRLELNPGNVLKDAKLTVLVNADQVIAAGGDTVLSPDNMDVSEEFLMVQEDGTAETRPVMASKGRDGSIWRFPLANVSAATGERVAQLNPPGVTDGRSALASGNRAASSMRRHSFGDNTWIVNVQAHPPTLPPNAASQVEDGQVAIMLPAVQ